MTSYFS